MKNYLMFATVLFLLSCGPASTPTQPSFGPITAKPAAPVTAPASLPLGSAQLSAIANSPGCHDDVPGALQPCQWYQEHVNFPGVSGRTTVPTAPDCPANANILCEAVADRSTGEFPSYLLFKMAKWFRTVPGDTTEYHPSLSAYHAVSITITVISPAGTRWMFDSEPDNKGTTPAHARAYIGRAPGMADTDRWFATHAGPDGTDDAACLLQTGTCTVTVPLDDPTYWVDVFAHRASESPALTAAFRAAVANPQYVGIVFGGGWNLPHGAAPTLPSEIQITKFSFTK